MDKPAGGAMAKAEDNQKPSKDMEVSVKSLNLVGQLLLYDLYN